MGVLSSWCDNPFALFLSEILRCEDCEFPCEAKEHSSQANCERHMRELLRDGKISITIVWHKDITLKRKDGVRDEV